MRLRARARTLTQTPLSRKGEATLRHRAGQTLVYFSVSNSLAIKKINSTQGDRSLYSEAKGSAARRQTSRMHGGHYPGNKLGSGSLVVIRARLHFWAGMRSSIA